VNYLAHIYLSNEEEEITLGNFIADGVKGKKYVQFPLGIQQGILLHRAIDSYTDAHPIVRKSTKRLHKKYSHYSGVIVDILYDHFLAKNWTQYHSIPLHKYTENFYNLINSNFDRLTPRIQKMMPYMIEQNWLLSYASIDGIGKILDQMNRRTNNQSKMNLAVIELTKYYKEFEEEFTLFFKDLKKYSKNKIIELKNL
jgi:acyl carrier protein phosphodiesterase